MPCIFRELEALKELDSKWINKFVNNGMDFDIEIHVDCSKSINKQPVNLSLQCGTKVSWDLPKSSLLQNLNTLLFSLKPMHYVRFV